MNFNCTETHTSVRTLVNILNSLTSHCYATNEREIYCQQAESMSSFYRQTVDKIKIKFLVQRQQPKFISMEIEKFRRARKATEETKNAETTEI